MTSSSSSLADALLRPLDLDRDPLFAAPGKHVCHPAFAGRRGSVDLGLRGPARGPRGLQGDRLQGAAVLCLGRPGAAAVGEVGEEPSAAG